MDRNEGRPLGGAVPETDERLMRDLERSLSLEGRAALSFGGGSGLAPRAARASIRSSLRSLSGHAALRARVARAADALDRGVPLERCASSRPSPSKRRPAGPKRLNLVGVYVTEEQLQEISLK